METVNRIGPQKWWCGVCDNRQVDSTDPTTGKFYITFGMEHPNAPMTQKDHWTSVLLAVCCECNPADALSPITIENVVEKAS
jgi:hypothetical protein